MRPEFDTPHPGTWCSIIPPHILSAIAQNSSDPKLRERALHSLLTGESLRTARIGLAESRTPTSRGAWQRSRHIHRLALAAAGALAGEPERSIFDAQHAASVGGPLVRAEGDPPTGDVEVNEAYDGLGATFGLYSDVFARDSLDGQGLALEGVVHFDRNYDNAMWDGRRMIFGDGDGVIFNRFTISVDVIGHELTHGVTQYESNLVYWAQPGALNESLSDVFGSLVKQYQLNQTADDADWIIGEGLFVAGINGQGIRSMKQPGSAYDDPQLGGKDPQPGNMSDYVQTFEDSGGVHINSGIPNRAFYETAVRIGGYAWEQAGQIWYATMTNPRLTRRANFRLFALGTLRTAGRLFGPGSDEAQAVAEAWAAVGVSLPAARGAGAGAAA